MCIRDSLAGGAASALPRTLAFTDLGDRRGLNEMKEGIRCRRTVDALSFDRAASVTRSGLVLAKHTEQHPAVVAVVAEQVRGTSADLVRREVKVADVSPRSNIRRDEAAGKHDAIELITQARSCLLYTSPSPR